MPRAFRFLLALVIAACVPPLAHAQGPAEAFTVRGVEVDVTAANVTQAKDQAIAEGQRKAFRQLLERLAAPADYERLPQADGVEYVRDFSVEKERSSSVRYIATLSVRFNPTAVRRLLRDAGINYAEPRTRPVLVVPVLKTPERAVLWDDPNPWRGAWASQGGGGLVPVQIPVGDLADLQVMPPDAALAADPAAIQALAQRYNDSDVLVAAAALAPGGRELNVALSASAQAPKPFDVRAWQMAEGESVEQLMARAVRDIQAAMDVVYKQPNVLQFDRAGTLSALVPLTGLPDWLAVRDGLGRVPQVRKWELLSLSKDEAAVTLYILGDQEQVRAALARQGLALEWGDGFWTMRPAAR